MKVKGVIVGSASVGKTTLLHCLHSGHFRSEYTPTILDEIYLNSQLEGGVHEVQVVDTAGQHDYKQLRENAYGTTDVVLICFSVVSRRTFDSVESTFIPEVSSHCGGAPIILIGTCCDRRRSVSDLKNIVKFSEAKEFAKAKGLRAYVETSALTQRGLPFLKETILRAALHSVPPPIPEWQQQTTALTSKFKRLFGGSSNTSAPLMFIGLSRECWWSIMSKLSLRDLAHCGCSCKSMKLLVYSNELWMPKCLELDPSFVAPPKGSSCREYVRDNGVPMWFNPKLFPDQIKRIEKEKQQALAAQQQQVSTSSSH